MMSILKGVLYTAGALAIGVTGGVVGWGLHENYSASDASSLGGSDDGGGGRKPPSAPPRPPSGSDITLSDELDTGDDQQKLDAVVGDQIRDEIDRIFKEAVPDPATTPSADR